LVRAQRYLDGTVDMEAGFAGSGSKPFAPLRLCVRFNDISALRREFMTRA
jgi:hypothetical protein